MKYRKSALVSLVIIICLLMTTSCGTLQRPISDEAFESGVSLARQDWSNDVRSSLNDLLTTYGKNGTTPAECPYAVFDFDNTSSIFDVEEQLAVYQLEVMAFSIQPGELKNVLLTGLTDVDSDLTGFGYGKGALNDWINDISDAYGNLWDEYGPFTGKGIDGYRRVEMQADPFWKEFSTKMRALYALIYDAQSSKKQMTSAIHYMFFKEEMKTVSER